jgi:SM-20-related protein
MSSGTDTSFDKIADGLSDQGFAVIDGFLSTSEVQAILSGDEFIHHKLHFQKAGIGKTDRQIIEGIRGDFIQWIDPQLASPAEAVYLDRIKRLLAFLNQSLFLSLKDVEIHRTVYPVGSRYQRHLDQFRSGPDGNRDHRKLSLICYLNNAWQDEHGGQLRLFLADGTLDILPEAGRLVCFRSDLIEHEVLPAIRERYSLTGWALDRAPGLPN